MSITFDCMIGATLVAFSVYTLIARQFFPKHFDKLEPMKRYWGRKKGMAIHIIAYTVIPLIGGALMMYNELSKTL